jgi:N-acetylglucosaminyl-diphospho-decaprenol L-rhamnosyltransferase
VVLPVDNKAGRGALTQARVAVVIVTYNSCAEIGSCLDALGSHEGLEIVVVDNASSDCTRTEVERRSVRFIANRTNAGFAAAVNQGVRATSAPLALLLNPDTHVVRGIDALADRFDDGRTGAAGGLLLSLDGTPQIGFFVRNLPTPAALIFEVLGINRLWPRNPVNWHYRCLNLDPMRAQAIEQPAGAFLMFRREAWEQVGGFDERFWPIWFEDVDFCARLRINKWSVCYEPNAVAIHRGAHSIRELPVEKLQRYWYRSLLGYAGKYYKPVVFRFVCLAVAAGAVGRSLAGVRRGGLRNIAIYAGVWGLAWKRFFTPHPDERLLLSDVSREI